MSRARRGGFLETERLRPIIAIDGPAGAGKSIVARRLAAELGFTFVDTGAIYRAFAYVARQSGVATDDPTTLGGLASDLVREGALRFDFGAGGTRVFHLGGEITSFLRMSHIGIAASLVSAHSEVRDAFLDLQRELGSLGGTVFEGRDIGTVVFPNADVKFFLTASPQVRAERRVTELQTKGEKVSLDDTLHQVQRRDHLDSMRLVAPLRRARDAAIIDSSALTIDETVVLMAHHVRAFDFDHGES